MADHSLTLTNCQHLSLTGVTNVDSFDDNQIVLNTVQGPLFLRGEDLHITQLNLEQGIVAVEGSRLTSLEYRPVQQRLKDKSRRVFERLLR